MASNREHEARYAPTVRDPRERVLYEAVRNNMQAYLRSVDIPVPGNLPPTHCDLRLAKETSLGSLVPHRRAMGEDS
jgi:hypothetical protein